MSKEVAEIVEMIRSRPVDAEMLNEVTAYGDRVREQFAASVESGESPEWLLGLYDETRSMYTDAIKQMHDIQ